MLTFDGTAPFPELMEARGDLAAGDWPAVARFFAGVTDPVDLAHAIPEVVRGLPVDDLLRQLVAQTGELLPRLLLADRLIDRAWESRTAMRAQYVSAEQFAGFFHHLRQAEEVLAEAAASAPADANVWALRVLTARGLELGEAETRRRYNEVAKRCPQHVIAQEQLLQRLAPKWGGSFESMHRFARRCLEEAPPGSSSGVLVARAHIEQWEELMPRGRAHSRREEVRRELTEAAERSVLHPDYRPGYRWVADHNAFALAFSQAGARRAAARHFRALGRFAHEHTWSTLPLMATRYRLNRAVAYTIGVGR